MSVLLVTGSAGMVGSALSVHFDRLGWEVHGLDSFQRAVFLGPQADTRKTQFWLRETLKSFVSHEIDVRDREKIFRMVQELRPDAIAHAAAQPSHDKAAQIPFDDFETNALGTLNLLEAVRRHCPRAVFVHFSTNKVYGDHPNRIRLKELESRWDYDDPGYADGIPEDFPVDQSKHSLFGVSKLASDLLVQEYGRIFGILSCCLRGGCLTGPNHAAVELHGFLGYLVKCNLERKTYRIYGYKGKQVRDNIHSDDVARFVEAFVRNPRCAEVYNLGGGRPNSCSILEAFEKVADLTGIPMKHEVVDQNREGDHICYISNLSKMRAHYPQWTIRHSLEAILKELVAERKECLVER